MHDMLASGRSFASSWTAHDQALTATFNIFRGRVIIVTVNEEVTAASGCSIDKLTRFIKELEQKFNVELLNRMLVVVEKDESTVEVLTASEVKKLLSEGKISADTIIYDTTVSNQQQLQNWRLAVKDSWLGKFAVKAR